MGRGPRSLASSRSRTSLFKGMKPSLVLGGSITSNRPSTSRHNRFDILSDAGDMDVTQTNIVEEVKPPKPPPIVVDIAMPLKELQHILGNDCIFKRTSIGTKVFPSNSDKYEFCKNSLKENKIEFHSFNSKENRLFTTFLHGLPKINTKDIIDDLQGYNLTPTSVTEVNTLYSSANDAVYKVQFVRKNFNPTHLQNVKTIKNVMISWRKQKPKNKNKPTQCWNCLMYGHGGEHCNRLPACMLCANKHHTNDCPFTKNNRRPAVFTCFNCKKFGKERTDHSANDINCPLRAHYLEIRENATSKQTRRVTSTRRTQPAQHTTHTDVAASGHHRTEDRHSYAAQVRNNNSDLFSIDQLFDIFTSALDELSKCTSKVQQMHVVMSMVKHAYDIK